MSMTFFSSNRFFLFFFLLLIGGCGGRCQIHRVFCENQQPPAIFIEMPKNNLVFANLSPMLYEVLVVHFKRLGYEVVDKVGQAYTLSVHIKSLEPQQKYVSPDVLLLHSAMRLELVCAIFDFNKQEIAKKTLFFTAMLSKPQDPILNSDFEDFVYQRLMRRAAPKIEQFVRPYLIKTA